MSSKSVDSNLSPRAQEASPAVWSITRRFTVLYVVSTAILLLLAVGFLYWTLQRNLDARERALLVSKVQVLRLLLREKPDQRDVLASEVEHEASESALKYFLRILDAHGTVLLETPGMNSQLPVALFPAPGSNFEESSDDLSRKARLHESFLLLSVPIRVGSKGQESRILQAGLDISTDQALLADYRNKLLIVLMLGLVFATVVGAWLARKGAQPLVEITKSARQITASQLQERIVVSHWPAELAELAGAINAMLDRLENSFARLSQFSADLAHELRTPINNLRGESEVALGRCRTPEEYQQVLASSLEEFDRLSRMIDGLLFIARADNPNAVVDHIQFDARKELDAVRDFYEALACEHNVTVECEGSGLIVGDPMLFRRAVSNLLGNALRHTPVGGKVQLQISSRAGSGVEVTVKDSGPGIAPEHLPKIFDRFYRIDRSPSNIPTGTGLGLAIVQSIMRLHGGKAVVESTPGAGTTFTLKFPNASVGQITEL